MSVMTMPLAMKKLVKSVARSFGASISLIDHELRDYLNDHRINCVLDVGACYGQYARRLRQLGYRERIISFEPVAATFALLSRAMAGDPMWSGHPFGLSDTTGAAHMNTYGDRADFNSLLNLNTDGHRTYGVPAATSQCVELRRLDQLLPGLLEGIASPRVFLKMDTQGHDLAVFRGAIGALDSIVGIQSEMAAIPLYDGIPSLAESLDFYKRFGYYPLDFQRVNTVHGVVPEFDVILHRGGLRPLE